MAEHVTQFDHPVRPSDHPQPRDERLGAVLERFGPGQQVRGDRRDSEAMFDWLVAAKARMPIRRVYRHVCRHDEGIAYCSSSFVEG